VGRKILKQEALLRKALRERGVDCARLEIRVDHMRGRNYVDDLEMGIIYPDSFLRKARRYHLVKKKYDFYFNGNMGKRGQRNRLMCPFQSLSGGKIIESNFGRISLFKSSFNYLYYFGLARARYGLCPHQINWAGPREDIWTYRFIECCLVKSQPVVFVETPLGENFIRGFSTVSDRQFLEMLQHGHVDKNYENKLHHNFELAKERFFLATDIVGKLRVKG
jgi:hypothetical protein